MGKRRNIISLCIILFSFFSVHAAGTLKFHFPGSEGQVASLYVYQDLMNYKLDKLAESNVDRDAKFSFELIVKHTQKIVVRVGYARFAFYAEPDADYDVYVDTLDFSDAALYPIQVVSYITPHYQVTKKGGGEDVNQLLNDFNLAYSKFLDHNYVKLYRKQNVQEIVDSAELLIKDYQSRSKNAYVHTHIDIQLAQLELMSRRLSREQLVAKYFTSDKIQYTNMAYMDFFNMFWKKHLLTNSKYFKLEQIDTAVNRAMSFAQLDALLSNDPLLSDSTLRQLVVLRSLQDMYVSRAFNRKAVYMILQDIAGHPRHREHQKIAVDLRNIFDAHKKESLAPEFKLVDFNNNPIQLSDFEGKYVLISAFSMDCKECIAELEFMVELNEEFDDIIQFVSVSFDQHVQIPMDYVKKKEYEWIFCHYNHDFIEDYNISMLPSFILIDKEGKIENFSCPFPSQYFQDYFLQMLNEKKGNLD